MVTTDMAKFYYDGKEIKSPYKSPFLLVKLNDNEEFECTCQAELGLNIEEKFDSPAIYDPVAACAYDQITENKFVLNFESKQQFDEKEIFRRALSCLVMRLQYLDHLVRDTFKETEKVREGILNIPDEDMTLGGILGYLIQMHKDVEFAGDHQPNIAMREIQIKYKCKSDIRDIFSDCVKTLINSVTSIAKQLKLELLD